MTRWFRIAFAVISAIVLLTTNWARAATRTNLLDLTLGSELTSPQVTKVVVERVDPWIARVINPTPVAFANGQAQGDAQAMFTDTAGIESMISTLKNARVGKEGCYQAAFTPQTLPVSWAVFLYNDDSRVGSIFLTFNKLCASTGTRMYDVDPFELGIYLERAFSFMNF